MQVLRTDLITISAASAASVLSLLYVLSVYCTTEVTLMCVLCLRCSRELIRVYSVEYSVNLETSKVWDNLDRLFRDGMLPQADAKDVTWAIYKNLVDQSLASWDQFLRQRELHQQQEAQQNVIDDALKGWGPQAMAQWQDQKMKLKPLAKPLKPTFPIYGCSPVTVLQAFQGMHASNVAALAALHRKLMPPTHASSQSGGFEAIERQHSGPRHLASEAQAGELASERQERRRLEVEGEERRRVRMDQEERRLYDDERRLYDVYPDHIMRCRVQMDQEERRREQLRARLEQQDKFLHVQAATQLAFRDMLPCLSPMVHGKTLSGVATHGQSPQSPESPLNLQITPSLFIYPTLDPRISAALRPLQRTLFSRQWVVTGHQGSIWERANSGV